MTTPDGQKAPAEDAAAIAPGIKAWEISAITASARAMCLAAYPHMPGRISGFTAG